MTKKWKKSAKTKTWSSIKGKMISNGMPKLTSKLKKVSEADDFISNFLFLSKIRIF